MAPAHSKPRPLAELLNEIMRLDGLDLTHAEREIISALSVICNRYDDVYAPELEEIRETVLQILDNMEIDLENLSDLTKKVKGLPDQNQCAIIENNLNELVEKKIAEVTFPKLLVKFIKGDKWNLIGFLVTFSIVILLAPYIPLIVISSLSLILEKISGIDLFELLPILKQLKG